MLSLCALLSCVLASTVWGQANTALVTGAERVFVRRGPGTEFPPFASLARGSVVEVQEMQGEWSRVKTASGQVGYMHSNFLALPNEAGTGAGAVRSQPSGPAPTPAPALVPPPAVRSDSAALNALAEKNKALEAQVGALQEELTALKNRPTQPAPTAAPAASGDSEDLRAELKRLTAAVEGLQSRVGGGVSSSAPPAGDAVPAEATERSVPSAALLLGAVGLLLGWLLGAAYGRSQERGRRSRIRF
jgi:hypothetical protein